MNQLIYKRKRYTPTWHAEQYAARNGEFEFVDTILRRLVSEGQARNTVYLQNERGRKVEFERKTPPKNVRIKT